MQIYLLFFVLCIEILSITIASYARKWRLVDLLCIGFVLAYPLRLRVRMALSTASTVTPTSAKTAIHMLAHPMVANTSTATLTPMAKIAF